MHFYSQIVGKVRLALAPPANQWQVALYPTACGLTTSPMPWRAGFVQIDFDFLAHQLRITTDDDGAARHIALVPRSVAAFYRECMEALRSLDIDAVIHPRAVEIPQVLRLDEDTAHARYDPDYAQRCWRVLLHTQAVMQRFRGHFLGKCSPVHFFWGSFDLAQTRFSGRPAPAHPGGVPNVAD